MSKIKLISIAVLLTLWGCSARKPATPLHTNGPVVVRWNFKSFDGTVNVTLAWNPSSSTNVVGYNLYYGAASGAYTNRINVGNTLTKSLVIEALLPKFFVVTAYDNFGIESDYSNELQYAAFDEGKPIEWDIPYTNFASYTVQMSTNLQTWNNIFPPFYLDRQYAVYRLKGNQ